MKFCEFSYLRNSVFLVTGGAGFIGSNLCEAILDLGGKVRCFDDFSFGLDSNIESFRLNSNFELIKGDIRNYDECLKASSGVDYILNQAAWGSVPRSMNMPLEYNENNVQGTLNMLHAAYKNNAKRFVFASSSSVYGDTAILPKVEGNEGEVLSPYALTKSINEKHARLYYKQYGLMTIGLRYFNVYGRRQNPDSQYAAVIPLFIKRLLNNEPLTVYGDGMQSRDFTYIENVIEANLRACLAPNESCGEVYNIACGEQITVLELIETLSILLDKKAEIQFCPPRKGDVKHSMASIENAKNKLLYAPGYNFKDGIKETIDWYIRN